MLELNDLGLGKGWNEDTGAVGKSKSNVVNLVHLKTHERNSLPLGLKVN